MKILFLDIETSAHVAESFELFNTNITIDKIREPTKMICVAAKWRGKKKVYFWDIHHHPDEMVGNIYKMMDEADVIVHFNGIRFDIPHLNREFILAGFPPPSPSKQLDIYQVVRKQFKFASNKLAYVTEALGLSGKYQHSGYSLWQRCEKGDEKAWKEMARYNRQDVITLEELYDKVLPWIPNHPHYGLYDGSVDSCPNCGSVALVKEGFEYTAQGKFQRHHCSACGKWSRSNKRLDGVTTVGTR